MTLPTKHTPQLIPSPPRKPSGPGRLLFCLLAAGLALVTFGCRPTESTRTPGAKYHCPMHPTYVRDRPSDCAICGMKLVPIRETAGASNAPSAAVTGASNLPSARVAVMVSPEKQHLIGMKTTAVEERALVQTIRATAIVQHDETRFARVAPRFGGWVKKLHVNATGQPLTKGDPLFTVYSPEVLATEREYLLALRQLAQAPTNHLAPEFAAAQQLADSARQRLELWEIGADEIRALEQRGEPGTDLLLRAPVSGHVVTKNAVEGKAFMAGETLYELADLDRVWLRVSFVDADFARIAVGQPARITFPQLDHRSLTSAITFLYPHLDPVTRRGEARLEVDNPGHRLRPDLWANVDLEVPLGTVLAVPASAIIDTGTGCIAFVHRADEHLEPRQVSIGARTDDFWQVTQGLQAGDQVVTRALFLIDAESQLKAAIAAMSDAP